MYLFIRLIIADYHGLVNLMTLTWKDGRYMPSIGRTS